MLARQWGNGSKGYGRQDHDQRAPGVAARTRRVASTKQSGLSQQRDQRRCDGRPARRQVRDCERQALQSMALLRLPNAETNNKITVQASSSYEYFAERDLRARLAGREGGQLLSQRRRCTIGHARDSVRGSPPCGRLRGHEKGGCCRAWHWRRRQPHWRRQLFRRLYQLRLSKRRDRSRAISQPLSCRLPARRMAVIPRGLYWLRVSQRTAHMRTEAGESIGQGRAVHGLYLTSGEPF